MWRLYSNSRQSVRPFIRLSVRPFSFVYPSIWNRIRATHHWNSGHLSLLAFFVFALSVVVRSPSSSIEFLDSNTNSSSTEVWSKNLDRLQKIFPSDLNFFFFFFFPLLIQCDRVAFKKLALLKNISNHAFEFLWIPWLSSFDTIFRFEGNSNKKEI